MTDTVQTKTTLKGWFETDDIPTQSQFDDLITTLRARGEDIDLEEQDIILNPSPANDHNSSGIITTMTVDVNAQGIGAPLYIASDGNLETCDADAAATMPCVALALETGTGSKSVLLQGFVRDDTWNWTTVGGEIYVSTTVGTLTQTAPSGTGDQVQVVGLATHADRMYFKPDLTLVEIA